LDATQHDKYEEAYKLISSSDKAIKPLQAYQAENSNKDSAFAQLLMSKTSYKVKETKITGDKATVDVEVTAPDITVMLRDVWGAAMASAFAGRNDVDLQKRISDKYKDGSFPMATVIHSMEMVKENDGWKVNLGWKLDALTKEAEQLEKDKKLDAAKIKYEEALKLDNNSGETSKKLDALNKKIAGQKEKNDYLDKIELKQIKVGQSIFSEPGIYGEVKNLGNRTLKEVEITIYFLDHNGNKVHEKTYHPVLVSQYSFGESGTPLKPGYSRPFGVKASDAPSEWAHKVQCIVTDLEFME
jgi:hypothetical protein